MEHRVVLVTGGSSGIGKSIGVYLTSKGFKVYGTTRRLEAHPGFTHFELLELDVRNPESIGNAISNLMAKEGRLDVLVNNAGIGITGPIEETPHAEILKAFDTNFNGPIHMFKAVLPYMRSQKKGLIINITSIAGYMGLPYRGLYSASKGALELVTEAMRMEVKGFGVNITNLAPGDFATNIASGRYHVPILEDSPYKASYGNTLQMMNEHVEKGKDPVLVAHMVHKIINTKEPYVHYKVGEFMQKFSLILKKILPDKVYEKLLMNHYKL
ncbi:MULTISPECIES: SDR family oxidoreductase [unclassified Arenibacter]|jgi:NAD(P)-dependent dehydrogenase (short-subunit alcohol dehydrogenase family)|uniref:SDR family oxidoreductase n=1 Tax=unclassified Arenibacter TaxID=2615047 RepID=UPI000E34B986|nr:MULTISPECIES: SDR family oxidoreductase [unclassified Arenibacter]MCM4163473.1 short-chain dehydrogenase/reductase [Arenibacter sp. A80]RFT57467.1 SDR family oxidoreductase [Arenibacter sp. P308M17]